MTADSSVLVAAFASWHERHLDARRATTAMANLVAHAELEAYSVLTRLPPEHRAPADLVAAWFQRAFAGDRLVLSDRGRAGLVRRLAAAGIIGGGVYDALIAITATGAGLTLVTLDRRAARVYDRLGVEFELLA